MNTNVMVSMLFLTDLIDGDEANELQKALRGMPMPETWQKTILQIEEIIGRPL